VPLAIGKPSTPVLVALLLAWLPFALGGGYLVWRRLRHQLDSRVAGLVGALVAVVAVMLPYQIARTVYLADRVDRPLSSRRELAPAYSFGTIDVGFFDRLRTSMPAGSAYFVAAPAPDLTIRAWSFYWLLPRVAVATRTDANWIVGRDVDRRKLGVRLAGILHGDYRVFAGREVR
jgi:hypothetical protein